MRFFCYKRVTVMSSLPILLTFLPTSRSRELRNLIWACIISIRMVKKTI